MNNQNNHGTITRRIAEFLEQIGLPVRFQAVAGPTPLPGILIRDGGLVVDPDGLLYPGDLLHEAGHLAVAPAERRGLMDTNVGQDPAEEMMAIAWSYAALVYIGLEPDVVFHPHGYHGASQSLIENFTAGRTIGVPMLQWVGMCADDTRAAGLGVKPYPHMINWIRPGSA